MNKSTHFFGQSVFGQLISMIAISIIARNSKRHKADHYVKRFTARDPYNHVVLRLRQMLLLSMRDGGRNAQIVRQDRAFPTWAYTLPEHFIGCQQAQER